MTASPRWPPSSRKQCPFQVGQRREQAHRGTDDAALAQVWVLESRVGDAGVREGGDEALGGVTPLVGGETVELRDAAVARSMRMGALEQMRTR